MCEFNKIFFFSCMYKMIQAAKKPTKKCKIETIGKGQYFCFGRRGLQTESGYSNQAAIFEMYSNKLKYRYELMPSTKVRPQKGL